MNESHSPSQPPHPLSIRPLYTPTQLSTYINHIFGPAYSLSELQSDVQTSALYALKKLQLRHLCHIPWGNVSMHYSPHKTLSLDTEALFTKIVTRGLGGYCMENNLFFATVMRSLGYELYFTGGRVSHAAVEGSGKHPDGFGGWEHMIILVNIAGRTYHVDVGFSTMGAIAPLLLEKGPSGEGVPGNQVRLVRKKIAEGSSGQAMWVLEMKNQSSEEWRPGYCFSELEFLEQDFRNLNFRTSRDPTSWFTYTLVMTRVLLEGEEDG